MHPLLVLVHANQAAAQDPRTHFVDDESSEDLMLGYSTSAYEVVRQLRELNMEVSDQNPLVVHIPCGVGGAPAGICWGLHQLLGNKARPLTFLHIYPSTLSML